MQERCPIGVFDSGYGGLTILREFVRLLPEYDYIYLGDNARTPYGTRSFDVVYQYTREAVEKLFDMGCRLVILACNTASAKALRNIQQQDLPRLDPSRRVLGVIRPSVEMLESYSGNRHIGILATKGTVASESYPIEVCKLYGSDFFHITQLACPMWVPLVENNELVGEGADFFVKKYIEELLRLDPLIDTVVLGCTHYPLLADLIRKYLPAGIRIINQGPIVARSLQNYLFRHPEIESRITRSASVRYYTTEKSELFEPMASLFMGQEVPAEQIRL